MYVIYQIGDVCLYDSLLGYNGEPVSAELEYGWDNPSTDYGGGGRQYHSPATFSLAEEVEFEISGQLFQTDYMRISQLMGRIRSMGGQRNLPIIVFHYEEGDCSPELRWLVGYGMITEAANNHNYHAQEDPASFIHQELELTITLQKPFEILSAWFWELRPLHERLLDPYSDQSYQAGLNRFAHPPTLDKIPRNHYFVRWQEPETRYDPAYWALKNLYEMSFGGVGADYAAAPLEVFLYADADFWAVAPFVIYSFTNLSAIGSISIETELKTGMYRNETLSTVSTLDLVQLDVDLALVGFGGLTTADEVVTGSGVPRPGFVRRNGVILEGVRPRWDYPYRYPGEISKGATWIIFTPYLTDAQVAYSIDFRTN